MGFPAHVLFFKPTGWKARATSNRTLVAPPQSLRTYAYRRARALARLMPTTGISVMPSTSLLRFVRCGVLLAVAFACASRLHAQAQFAGTYFGTLNSKVIVPGRRQH
jgi:hypothetical protein